MWKPRFPQLGKVGLIFACGLALFSDGYVNAVSGQVNTILTAYIYKDYDAAALKRFSSAFSSVAFAGTVVGMLTFGVLADIVGRKFGMIFACLWLALWSVLAAGAWGAHGSTGGLFAALIAYRFLIGIGIGAEYPAGSVAASENTEGEGVQKNRQQLYFVLSTNTAIDFGFAIAAFVPLVLLWICGTSNNGDLTTVWRVSLGLGAVCPLTILVFRAKMHEPVAYQKGKINYKKMPWMLIFKRYWVRFLAVCIAWFLYDYVTYPAGIYSSLILSRVVPNNDLYATFGWNTLINCFYIVGTFMGVCIIEVIGPKNCFILGLVCQSALAFGLAGGYLNIQKNIGGFTAMYGLFLAFGEVGPGNNLGLLASKSVAPTAVRGLFYGIAAAIGKVGAFTGTYAYGAITDSFAKYPNGDLLQITGPFYIAGGLALLSAAIVFFFIPPVVPDGMKKEDAAFIQYLEENGCDVRELGLVHPDEEDEHDLAPQSSNEKTPASKDDASSQENTNGVTTTAHELKA